MKKRQFPEDENGDVLRRLHENGDDLSIARSIDFSVVFPDERSATSFGRRCSDLGYEVKIEGAGTVKELPWDVVVVRYMLPTHAGISEFETELEEWASELGGRNDGWGCFEIGVHPN